MRARLADAAFFYNEDQKTTIDSLLGKLQSIVYHEEIGTLAEKVARVRSLANKIADSLHLSEAEKQDADRAAQIAKFDLVTNMVYEFPELQGLMGEKYAVQKGEKEAVAKAINEHYMPRSAEDGTAPSNVGAVLALAEKLDTIVSFFGIGLIPSGSQDPYALRRQATGIIQTLLDKNWDLSLGELINNTIDNNTNSFKVAKEELYQNIISFFTLRIKHILQEKGIRYDLIDAVLGNKLASIASLVRKAQVLEYHKEDEGFKEGIEALSRVINISNKAAVVGEIKTALFENEEESALYEKYLSVKESLATIQNEEEAFQLLFALKTGITNYFDHTMVMAEDENVKANRLNQMKKLADLITQFANVNEILVK